MMDWELQYVRHHLSQGVVKFDQETVYFVTMESYQWMVSALTLLTVQCSEKTIEIHAINVSLEVQWLKVDAFNVTLLYHSVPNVLMKTHAQLVRLVSCSVMPVGA